MRHVILLFGVLAAVCAGVVPVQARTNPDHEFLAEIEIGMSEARQSGIAPTSCPLCELGEGVAEGAVRCSWGVLTGSAKGVKSTAAQLASPLAEGARRIYLGFKSLYDDKATLELAQIAEKDRKKFKAACDFVAWVAERDVLIAKAAAGNREARAALARIGEEDKNHFKAYWSQAKVAAAAIAAEYRDELRGKTPAKQTQILCDKIGKLGFEGIALIAGGKSIPMALKALGKSPRLLVGASKSRSPGEVLAYLKSSAKPVSMRERYKLAQEVLGKDGLSRKLEAAIEKAHTKVGKGKKYGEYTPAELKEKMRILMQEGGLTVGDADKLLRAGICGDAASAMSAMSAGLQRVGDSILRGAERSIKEKQVYSGTNSTKLAQRAGEEAKAAEALLRNNVDGRDIEAVDRVVRGFSTRAEVAFAESHKLERSIEELNQMRRSLPTLQDPKLMKAYLLGDGGGAPYDRLYGVMKAASQSGMDFDDVNKMLDSGMKFKEFSREPQTVLRAMEDLLDKENALLQKSGDALDQYRAYRNAQLQINIFEKRAVELYRHQSGNPAATFEDAYDHLSDSAEWSKQYSARKARRDELRKAAGVARPGQ